MTQEERWNKRYDEVVTYMNRYHRNPSKHRIEDHLMLNWMKHQRKLMNRGDLSPDRVERFRALMAKGERYKRENQWVEIDADVIIEDALRGYQQKVLERLNEMWQENRSVMVQMPTGTGKTHLMAAAIKQFLDKTVDEGVLVVAHRRELIEQISEKLKEYEILHKVIEKDSTGITGKTRVAVTSIQKLSRPMSDGRSKMEDVPFSPSLVVVDEAHHALARTYKMLWDWWPKAKFLGLTATPCRLSGEPFTDLFDALLQSWPMKRFIREGWLSDMDYVSVKSNSISVQKVASLDKRGTDGDFQTKQVANVMDRPESIAHLYKSYKQFADGKRGIVYAINRLHGQHIMEYYRGQGVSCAWLEAQTPAKERKQTVEDYRNGLIDVCVSCDILGEGVDFPAVEFIQLARPTLSLSKYLQQIGRGMRKYQGKDIVTILDQVGLYLIFGLPTSDWDWAAMFRGEKKGKGVLPKIKGGWTWSEQEDKLLVNEDMFRIDMDADLQSASVEGTDRGVTDGNVNVYSLDEWYDEQDYGRLTVFRKNAAYGIRRDGEVVCEPRYVDVRKSYLGEAYPLMALLPRAETGNGQTWTVIDSDGNDLNARMEGEIISEKDGLIEYRRAEWGRFVTSYWDARHNLYYMNAGMKTMGGLPFIYSQQDGLYWMRGDEATRRCYERPRVLYNDNVTIVDNDLYVKGDELKRYDIVGYCDNVILVRAEYGSGLLQVWNDGTEGERTEKAPKGMSNIPNLRLLNLHKFGKWENGTSAGSPRDYQKKTLEAIDRAMCRNNRIVVQMPTGMGKNYIAMRELLDNCKKRKISHDTYYIPDVLTVVHRREWVATTAERIRQHDISLKEYKPGWFGLEHIYVISADQTEEFIKRHEAFDPEYIIIDEAHLVTQKTYAAIGKKWPNAKVLGLTATPCGADGQALKGFFTKMLQPPDLKYFIDRGLLKEVVTKEVPCQPTNVKGLYAACQKLAQGKQGVVFADSTDLAQKIAACYTEQGVSSSVSGFDMEAQQRERILDDYRMGKIRVLVTTDYFSQGGRCPFADFIQLARTTDSLTEYLHQVECGMKAEETADDDAGGKSGASQKILVIDHVGLIRKFGKPTEKRDWERLFAEGTKPEGETAMLRRKKNADKTKRARVSKRVEPTKALPALTKWQRRMERLREDMSVGQPSAGKVQ
mgnify:FL=1